jgi:asparagine synthetase B (glutamine-hydrolysing)
MLKGRRLYVTLSGGLDSSAIAAFTREFVGEFTAITFGVEGVESEDMASAELVARALGVELMKVWVSPKQILEYLDVALLYGQDWREFNVHCALVNAPLGAAIQKHHAASESHADTQPTAKPVLLTGDVMNELMIDYTAVHYKGGVYYALPNVQADLMRRVLVAGLDSGDREVGVFWHYGLEVIQPYALAADAYVALPPSCLTGPGAKQDFQQKVFGERVPAHVYKRPKTRAQEGTKESGGGTLAICVDNGVDEAWLKKRFAELYTIDAKELPRYMRNGRYRHASISLG